MQAPEKFQSGTSGTVDTSALLGEADSVGVIPVVVVGWHSVLCKGLHLLICYAPALRSKDYPYDYCSILSSFIKIDE